MEPTLVRDDGTVIPLTGPPVEPKYRDLWFHGDGRVSVYLGDRWMPAEEAGLEVREAGAVVWPPAG